MLQYYMTIIAYTPQVLDIEDLFENWNLSQLYSRHINFYSKKLTQVEVGCGLLNVD